jgi:hypothetical protein
MINLLIAITGIAFFLLLGEYLWQKKVLKGEYARKFVHITSATFVATWPIFLSQIEIAIISFLFIIALVITKKTKLFRSLRSIRRATYGEIWYALGIGASAILFSDGSVFAVAVLTMALADGFAAVSNKSTASNYRFVASANTLPAGASLRRSPSSAPMNKVRRRSRRGSKASIPALLSAPGTRAQRFTGVTRRRWSIPMCVAEALRRQARPR